MAERGPARRQAVRVLYFSARAGEGLGVHKYNSSGRQAMGETTAVTVHFENSQPILRVEDMETSLRFYVGKLGVKNASWGSEDFTSITRDAPVMCLWRCAQGPAGAGGFTG